MNVSSVHMASIMAVNSFHQFPFLPPELRRIIYLLASPPRFVPVLEEHEDREAFEERFRTTPVQLELHPNITYFARNWRHRIPWPPSSFRRYYRRHQATLETYGFSCPRAKHQPWVSTRDAPGIPHHFLSENPDVAWELVRSGFFYCATPVPVMLHVTKESRQVLIDYGYELAFGTRTHSPRTWFNFNHDILYVSAFGVTDDDHELHSLLSGKTLWDIGQFDPVDLKKVKRLALESSALILNSPHYDGTHIVSNILQLFTGVEELFLEECSQDRLEDAIHSYKSSRPRRPNTHSGHSQFWCHTPVLEVDALIPQLFNRTSLAYSTGYDNLNLRAYKDGNMGDGSRFFDDAASEFEEELTKKRDELVHIDSIAPWNIPKISIVQICCPWMCRDLFDWRWDIWNRFQTLKEEEARNRAAEEAQRSISVPSKLIYTQYDDNNSPPSPFTEKYRDDLQAYEDGHREDWIDLRLEMNAHYED
ncbi:hypothetical protein HD806DRAFT_492388 [Xylariaceae sp. AK1471]|nr:hypothetical protein HD806DRAFT_492388 [Xylariaceae sp. AK1471]